MKSRGAVPSSVDAYIAAFPEDIQKRLKSLLRTVRAAAPGAEERISYGMPAFKQNGILVYFAAFKNHIGFFPTSSGVEAFKRELKPYETAKGTVRFPHDTPLPLELIGRIVRFRVDENRKRARRP
jgi:uncharacterized protein YdhG (YjbR/CyaY superfamily)